MNISNNLCESCMMNIKNTFINLTKKVLEELQDLSEC